MLNYKTSFSGLLLAIGAFLQTLPSPPWCSHVGSILVGLGGLALGYHAKDSKPADNPATGKVPHLSLFIGMLACFTLAGCARFSASSTPDGQLQVRAYTLFDSKSELAKLAIRQSSRTNGSSTASIGLSGLDHSSSSTNLNNIIESIVSAAIKAAK